MIKNVILIIMLFLSMLTFTYANTQTNRQVRNLAAFTKLYGYIRFYYPSDEAQTINWDKFSVYGSAQVMKATDDAGLQKTLYDLFLPVAPLLKLSDKKEMLKPDLADLTPPDASEWNTTCWQYQGLQDNPRSIYISKRTNRPIQITVDPQSTDLFSVISFTFAHPDPPCPEYRLTMSYRMLESDTCQAYLGVQSDWAGRAADSLMTTDWQTKEYIFERNENLPFYNVNLRLIGIRNFLLDDLKVEGRREDKWVTVYTNGFEDDNAGYAPSHLNLDVFHRGVNNASYNEYKVISQNGNQLLSIESSHTGDGFTNGYHTNISSEEVPVGTFETKQLAKGLYCRFPIALYGNAVMTYPAVESNKISSLKNTVDARSISDLNELPVRLGAVLIYWNVMQHFYPYWRYAGANWSKTLEIALGEMLQSPDSTGFERTMLKMISVPRDGHRNFSVNGKWTFLPGFLADWIEDKWIVTRLLHLDVNVPVGSEVIRINGRSFRKFMESEKQYFTSGSEQSTYHNLFRNVMINYPDSSAVFTFRTPGGDILTQNLKIRYVKPASIVAPQDKVREYSEGVYYVNINTGKVGNQELQELLPALTHAKGIIFDWGDNPEAGTDLICNLLTCKDTLYSWDAGMYLYPDQECVTFRKSWHPQWMLEPKEPHLNAKVVFLCGAGDLSYEESFLEYIKYYKLGTLIGEPTGGTTGNVAYYRLPGGYQFIYTGMFVDNPDGSRFHGIGVIPDIIVKPTIEGVSQNRDEVFDAAMNYMQKELGLSELPKEIE